MSAAVAGCSSRARPGQPAPDFHLTLLNGHKVSLASYRGRVLVLNFWASWCPPCIEETPALNTMAQDFRDGKVVVLGVSIDEDPVAYRTFLTRFHIQYPTARDPGQDLMHRYGTRQIPETYIIGPNGRLARKLVSSANWTSPSMLAYIRNLAGTERPGLPSLDALPLPPKAQAPWGPGVSRAGKRATGSFAALLPGNGRPLCSGRWQVAAICNPPTDNAPGSPAFPAPWVQP